MPPADVLGALDPEQREVATSLHGPVCVLAGAGTGKTRAITHRIAHGVLTGAFDPHRVLAVTFTTRAAGELRGRLRELGAVGVQARTFHSAALRQARYFWPQTTGADLPPLTETKLPLLGAAAARCRLPTDRALLRDLATEVEWAKVSNVLPERYVEAAVTAGRLVAGADPDTVARAYAAYEEVKRDRHLIDMEDVLLAAVGLLSAHPGVADAVRGQYRHFVVDEYQDVSPLQQRLLELWLGDRDELCVVGDPAQTIYTFAGARPDYLVGFRRRFPRARLVRLVRDYRSTPEVVAVANAVLAGGSDAASRAAVELVAQRRPGATPVFAEQTDEVAEAAFVADHVQQLVRAGTAPRDIAVLFRVNAMSEAFEQAFTDAGIPYVVRGAARFFDRPEVRRAGLLLRGAARAGDEGDAVTATRAVLTGAGWSAEPPPAGGAAREQWESLAALVALAADVAARVPGAGLTEVVAELEARAAAQHAPVADGVTLASLHSAKGLEWDAVFVVGCHEGTLPLSYAQTPAEVDEERRLLYVGVTRAREHLVVTWSTARTPGARPSRGPSRFLDGVRWRHRPGDRPPVDDGGRGGRRRPRGPVRCRVCGTVLHDGAERKLGRCWGCPSTLDEDLFERLRAWRLEEARQQSVPAYVVFTDATLTAIAEARPGDRQALAAIAGVGPTKLERYGPAVLALCQGVSATR